MNAIANFKSLFPATHKPAALAEGVAQLCAAKGIAHKVITSQPPQVLQILLGHLLGHYPSLQQACAIQGHLTTIRNPTPSYEGTIPENRAIDLSIYESSTPGHPTGMRASTWRGAAGCYHGGSTTLASIAPLRHLPIAIIGAGPAGILAARSLTNLGFRHIHWMDENGQYGGIWHKTALQQGRQALPFPIQIENHTLKAAPGDGIEVMDFLHRLVHDPEASHPLPPIRQARVTSIIPGDLDHQLQYITPQGQSSTLHVPLLINAIGVCDPLAPSRPGKMTTTVHPLDAGLRWQEAWSEAQARALAGKKLIFIGLSNATLEMLRQIHLWEDRGVMIEYQVITHYPDTSLHAPTQRVEHKEKTFHFYRNLQSYHLLRVAGDLGEVAHAFNRALKNGCIRSHIVHWDRPDPHTIVITHENGDTDSLQCDRLYTLIGYGPEANLLDNMGLRVNNRYLGAVDMDFDAEVQRPSPAHLLGRARTWPGYFTLGIRNSFNPNEVLLPGLTFRLPNVIAGLLLRACEITFTATFH